MAKQEEDKELNKESQNIETSAIEALKAEVEALKAQNIKDQATMKMLYEVADKGRIFNYEAGKTEKKPIEVKLSLYGGGIIVGWRTIKDTLVKHPTTGRTVGEEQEYELLILDKENNTSKAIVVGYPAFSDARYTERIEAEVAGKKEDWNGDITFDVKLPDGRVIPLGSRFVN